MVKVLSVGGSIVVPEFPDSEFLKKFSTLVRDWLSKDEQRKLILVVGGGGPARIYQNAYKEIIDNTSDNSQADWIGIMATRLNAQLLKAIFSDLCTQDVVYDPTAVSEISGRISSFKNLAIAIFSFESTDSISYNLLFPDKYLSPTETSSPLKNKTFSFFESA